MEINDDLFHQWEPKVHSMLHKASGLLPDYDEAAQELRMTLLRAAKNYRSDRGASFHTYLHWAMLNTLRSILKRAGTRPQLESLDEMLFEPFAAESQELAMSELVAGAKLTPLENYVLARLLAGYNAREVLQECSDPQKANQALGGLRAKFSWLKASPAC